MGKRRKRRTWSDDEKREICVQTAASGVSVAQVARRYALNANLVHNWLKDPRFTPDDEGNGEAAKAASCQLRSKGRCPRRLRRFGCPRWKPRCQRIVWISPCRMAAVF